MITWEQQILADLTDQLKWNTEILDITKDSMESETLKNVENLMTQNRELIQKANQKIDEIKQANNK